MFTSSNHQRLLVTLTLSDGKKLVASIKASMTGKLADVLNGTDSFIDIITGDGQAFFLAKSQVIRCELTDPPQAKLNQQRRNTDRAQFNPWAILGIDKTASKETIRQAYLALVKLYHPDRINAYDLPQEMKEYAAAMAAQINLAYEQIG